MPVPLGFFEVLDAILIPLTGLAGAQNPLPAPLACHAHTSHHTRKRDAATEGAIGFSAADPSRVEEILPCIIKQIERAE